MKLMDFQENDGWLMSKWALRDRTDWSGICKAVMTLYDGFFMTGLVGEDDEEIKVESKEGIAEIPEGMEITLRGMSLEFGVPLMLTFFNQTNAVNIVLAEASDEYKNLDRASFEKCMSAYAAKIENAIFKS